jgi:hypothetical protein
VPLSLSLLLSTCCSAFGRPRAFVVVDNCAPQNFSAVVAIAEREGKPVAFDKQSAVAPATTRRLLLLPVATRSLSLLHRPCTVLPSRLFQLFPTLKGQFNKSKPVHKHTQLACTQQQHQSFTSQSNKINSQLIRHN